MVDKNSHQESQNKPQAISTSTNADNTNNNHHQQQQQACTPINQNKFGNNNKDNDAIKEELIMSLLKNKKNNEQSFSNVIQSFASSLYYKYFQPNTKFYFKTNANNPVFLFAQEMKSKADFDKELLSVIYFSYRNKINPLYDHSAHTYISTDCGWGCMIRSAQMILARGLFELKRAKIINNNRNSNNQAFQFQYNSMSKIRDELIYLFNDNSIPIEYVISLEDYSNLIKGIEHMARKNTQYNYIEEVIAPFSIQAICHLTKSAGQWTSCIKMINTFIEINRCLYNKHTILHYVNCSIKEVELYNAFCKPIGCYCDINALEPGMSLCNKCLREFKLNNDNIDKEIFNYNGSDYRFNTEEEGGGGIIFISFRLGLKKIEKEYIEGLKQLMGLNNNIGIIGGKNDRAYYFIGYTGSGKQLLFLDPHLDQEAIDIRSHDVSSYFAKDIYLLDPYDMSPELTVGVCIKSLSDLRGFIEEIKHWCKTNNCISINIR